MKDIDQRKISAVEAANWIGCGYRMLDYWLRHTMHSSPVGSGHRRRLSEDDVETLDLYHRLSAVGFSVTAIPAAVLEGAEDYELAPGISITVRRRSFAEIVNRSTPATRPDQDPRGARIT